MPVAVRTYPIALSPPLTQNSLTVSLRDALVAAGFPSPLKQYMMGTDQYCLWQLIFDATKPMGTVYYRLKVTSGLFVSHTIGTSWADASNTLGNAPTDTHSTSFSASQAVSFTAFQSSEIISCICSQGTTVQFNAGYLRLADSPQWDEVGFPKVFIPGSNNFSSLVTTSATPYGSTTSFTTSLNNSNRADADSYYGLRSLIAPIWLWGPSNTGIVAMSSSELAMGANNLMAAGSVHNPPGTTESWHVTRAGAGTLSIRIA